MIIGLETVATYLPEKIITLEDRAYLAHLIPPLMAPPKERRQCRRPDAAEFQAVEAAKKALAQAGRQAADIDLLMVQQIGGRYVQPGVAPYVHHALGLPRTAPAWNIQTICASFVDGCRIAATMVKAGAIRRAMIITLTASETGGWGTDQTGPSSAAMGDAAACAIVSADNVRFEILAYANETHSNVCDALPMGFDDPGHPELAVGRVPPEVFNKATGPSFSPEFMDWMTSTGRKIIVTGFRKALAEAGLTGKDVDYVVVHQAFLDFLEIWMDELHDDLGVRKETLRETWDLYGNTGACDVPVTLAHVVEHETIRPGAVFGLFGPGGGGHTPTMLVRWRGA